MILMFGYSLEDADQVVGDYIATFRNQEWCETNKAHLHGDDLVHHEGPVTLAKMMHYFSGAKHGHKMEEFIRWRGKYDRGEL